jgi:hypothetical protein
MTRRPVPALVSLAALLVLTGLVWWRVLHRDDGSAGATGCPTPTASATATITATLPAPASVTVQVLNATNRGGLAAQTRTALAGVGFLVPSPAGNDKPNLGKIKGVAEIRYGPKGAPGAKLLSYYVPGAQLKPVKSTTATVVLSLGAKFKNIATRASAEQAMTRAHVAVAGSTPEHPTSSSSPGGC